MSDFLKLSGNRVKAQSLVAQANQLKNFMLANLRNSGRLSEVRKLKLFDGSLISIRITSDASYGHFRSVVSIFGSGVEVSGRSTLFSCYKVPNLDLKRYSRTLIPVTEPIIKVSNNNNNTLYEERYRGYWYNKEGSLAISWTQDRLIVGKQRIALPSGFITSACLLNSRTIMVDHLFALKTYRFTPSPVAGVVVIATFISSIPNPFSYHYISSFNERCDKLIMMHTTVLRVISIDRVNSAVDLLVQHDTSEPLLIPTATRTSSRVVTPLFSEFPDSVFQTIVANDITISANTLSNPGSGLFYKLTYRPNEVKAYRENHISEVHNSHVSNSYDYIRTGNGLFGDVIDYVKVLKNSSGISSSSYSRNNKVYTFCDTIADYTSETSISTGSSSGNSTSFESFISGYTGTLNNYIATPDSGTLRTGSGNSSSNNSSNTPYFISEALGFELSITTSDSSSYSASYTDHPTVFNRTLEIIEWLSNPIQSVVNPSNITRSIVFNGTPLSTNGDTVLISDKIVFNENVIVAPAKSVALGTSTDLVLLLNVSTGEYEFNPADNANTLVISL